MAQSPASQVSQAGCAQRTPGRHDMTIFDSVPEVPHVPQVTRRQRLRHRALFPEPQPPSKRTPRGSCFAAHSQRVRRERELPRPKGAACKHEGSSGCCQWCMLLEPGKAADVAKWRSAWEQMSGKRQRNEVLVWARARAQGAGAPRRRPLRRFEFLGVPLCGKAFKRFTGVNTWRAVKDASEQRLTWEHAGFARPQRKYDEMHTAIKEISVTLRASSPFPEDDLDVVNAPFTKKQRLFDMIYMAYWLTPQKSQGSQGSQEHPAPPQPAGAFRFTEEPKYATFYRVMQSKDFANFRFHRYVKIGRCSKCCLAQHKIYAAATEDERAAWRALLAEHNVLQLNQKRCYVVARSAAARDYPESELYLAADGGSGFEFWLPHLSPADVELPSKAADNVHTPGFKVMNVLVHGDRRSHVILSPWSTVAGSNHVCECVALAVNQCFVDHGKLPRRLTFQADNASVNHSMLVMSFLALYVLFNCVESARLRFMLENHAHDIYDAFHAIHKRVIENNTFYTLEEMMELIRLAHKSRAERTAAAASQASSAPQAPSAPQAAATPTRASALDVTVGPEVLVSTLLDVRDIWEWLFPGRNYSTGACVYYSCIAGYRDFELRRNAEDPQNPKVELWAKRFMSSREYQYIGTLTTWKLFRKVARHRPGLAADTATDAKAKSNTDQTSKLNKLGSGPYREQFTPERLADAKAICAKDWKHFEHNSGACPIGSPLRRLPTELSIAMRAAGVRRRPQDTQAPQVSPAVPATAWEELRRHVNPMRQLEHSMAGDMGIARGVDTGLTQKRLAAPKTAEDYAKAPITPGCFVLTDAYPKSAAGHASPKLAGMPTWVWQIAGTHAAGAALRPNSRGAGVAEERVHEAHLFLASGGDLSKPVRQVWEKRTRPMFLETSAGTAAKASKASKARGADEEPLRAPIIAYLRADNIIGGGFPLTRYRKIPVVVRGAAKEMSQAAKASKVSKMSPADYDAAPLSLIVGS